jgi:hypothetical protein
LTGDDLPSNGSKSIKYSPLMTPAGVTTMESTRYSHQVTINRAFNAEITPSRAKDDAINAKIMPLLLSGNQGILLQQPYFY